MARIEKVWIMEQAFIPWYNNGNLPAFHSREDCPAL